MIDRVLSFGFAVLGACCALANEMVPVEGTVAETSVVSVPLRPWLATQVTRGRPDALAAELRVVDGKGADVPYVLRPMRARVEKYERCWHDLTVTKVTESDGRLEVEATVPAGLEKAQLVALDVQTPREDFEQVVTVRSDRGHTAEGVICDYARFANFRKTEIPLEMHGAARPCYDSVVGDYIANVQDPVRWDVKMTDAWGDADGPTAVWLVWNPIPCVTAVVFVLLLGVCFWLFRTVKQENA